VNTHGNVKWAFRNGAIGDSSASFLFVLSPLRTIKFLLQQYLYFLVAQVTTMPSIQALKHVPGSAVDFGVAIDNVDLENLTCRYLTNHCRHLLRCKATDIGQKSLPTAPLQFDPATNPPFCFSSYTSPICPILLEMSPNVAKRLNYLLSKG
jgi:hypothetical protein